MENNPIQQRRNETIMPGYILHLTAAQMFLKTQKGQEFLKTKQDKNDFLIGICNNAVAVGVCVAVFDG